MDDDDLSRGRLPSGRATARTRRRGAGAVLVLLGLLLVSGVAAPAGARTQGDDGGDDDAPAVDPDAPVVDVIEVDGLLDPVLVDFVEQSIADAEAAEDIALVLQMNSPGSVVSDEQLTELARAIVDSIGSFSTPRSGFCPGSKRGRVRGRSRTTISSWSSG